jgi:hypothetical protein
MFDPCGNVAHDFCDLRLAVGTGAVGEHAHRHLVFADAVDASGKMIFGAEGDLQKAFDDLAVGEDFLFGSLAVGDRRDIRRCRRRRRDFAERKDAQDCHQDARVEQ